MRNRKGGFSLAETLVAVAIIVILLAVAAIAVPRYVKTMTQLEFDGTAKEIFVAAQNSLTKAVGQGYLGAEETDFGEKDGASDIYYFVSASADADSVFGQILPFGAIDDTVRLGGSYIIRYQKSSGLVLDVFYSEPHDRNGCALAKADYAPLLEIRADKAARRSYNKKIVGYYGGTEPVALPENTELKAPTLDVINGDTLSVCVKAENTSPDAYLRLTIKGEDSGKSVTFDLAVTSISYYRAATKDYLIVLDDITVPGKKFGAQAEFAGFAPGENLVLQAETYVKDKNGNVIQAMKSPAKKTNSLFGDLNGATVTVSNLRHLENLDESVSGFTGAVESRAVTSAVQTTDLSLKSFAGGSYTYIPVTPHTSLSYDGGGFTVSGIKAACSGNAGLFGSLSGGTIENLVLEDFNISSTGGSAGAVAGYAYETAFSNILVYNNTSSNQSDAGLSVSAGKNAGGLVGTMEGGSVENCAAAVYVEAGEYAGGLIGAAASVGEISSSYAGGHTENSRYLQITANTEAARINVQGTLGAGGLVGKLDSVSEVSYSYSTCSVIAGSTGAAGGLAAEATGTKFKHCYTTSFVENSGFCENYIGKASGCTFEGNNYYLTNLSPKVENTLDDVTGVSGKDNGLPNFVFLDDYADKRQSAYIYDDTLKVDYGGKYYFPTVAQLHAFNGDTGYTATAVTGMHYGDWQVPYLDTLDYYIRNEDTLYLEISPEKLGEKEYFIFSITGETSTTATEDNAIYYLVQVKDFWPTIVNQGVQETLPDGTLQIKWAGSVANRLPVGVKDGRIIITLDDVATPYRSFHELFAGTKLIPGENIAIRLIVGNQVGINEIMEVGTTKTNSLFAYGSTGAMEKVSTSLANGTACVGYVRHLQNLNTAVSGTGKASNTFKKAVLLNSIDWESCKANYPGVYTNGTAISSGEFPGLTNLTISEFDGRENCLENFELVPSVFKTIDKPLNVHDLELLDCTATEGILAGTVSAADVTVDTVLVHHSDGNSEAGVSGTGAVGGLIGKVTDSGKLTLGNSSASLLVSSAGAAGGLIGENSGTVTMDSCYAGGHTENGKYSLTKYNIVSSAGSAGGLIAVNNGTAAISRSFGAASVSGTAASGGLVGKNDGTLSLDQVYTIAPVKGVRTDPSKAATVYGAGVGTSAGTVTNVNQSVFFLPELYVGNDDLSKLDGVDFVGTGAISSPAQYAYYQRNEDSNLVSAKVFTKTMQIETLPYDATLIRNAYGSVREYPFSIWTSFPKAADADGAFLGTYYGDWEPINAPVTVTSSITFSYTDPLKKGSGGSPLVVDLSAQSLGTQELIRDAENRFLIPATPYYPGYEVSWTVYSGSQVVPATENNGTLTVPAKNCTSNLTAVGTYSKADPDKVSVIFYYDPSGAFGTTAAYQELGTPRSLNRNTTWGDFLEPASGISPVQAKTINGYRFIGWYKDAACTNAWTDTDAVDKDVFAYAKYEKLEFYQITIDFLYEIDDGEGHVTTGTLTDIPRYSIDDQPQYRVTQPKGLPYASSITIPAMENLDPIRKRIVVATEEDYGVANCGETGVYEADAVYNVCNIYAEDTAHFQVIYTVPAKKAQVDIGLYRVRYDFKDTDPAKTYEQVQNSYDTYKSGETNAVHPFETYTPIEIKKVGDNEFEAVIPTVEFEEFEFYNRATTQETLKESGLVEVKKEKNAETGQTLVYYDLVVEYARKSSKIFFNTSGGTPVAPIEKKIGEPIAASITNGITTTREGGYTFTSWSSPYLKGDTTEAPLATGTSWNIKMPASNIEFKAAWTRSSTSYTIITWRQKVTDDRDEKTNKQYDFVSSTKINVTNWNQSYTVTPYSLKDSAGKAYNSYGGTNATGDWSGFRFDRIESEYKGEKTVLNTNSTVSVSGDGQTVINVYYDRNEIVINFSKAYPYTPTEKERTSGKTFTDGTHTLTYVDGKWGYDEEYTVTEYLNRTSLNVGTLYTKANDNDGTQYAPDGRELYSQWVGLGWFGSYHWYYSDNDAEYTGSDRYKASTPAEVSNTNTSYYYFNGSTMTKTPNGKYLKLESGTYYYYDVSSHQETRHVESLPTTSVYRGLYGQPLSKYGYSWQSYQGSTTYYASFTYNAGTDKYTGVTSKGGNPMTFLGEFKFPNDYINCTYVSYSSPKSGNSLLFVKQDLDGNWPGHSVSDVDNVLVCQGYSTGSSLTVTDKFEGFHPVEYYNTSGKRADTYVGDSASSPQAVMFERQKYPLTVYLGYMTPYDGIIFPEYGTNKPTTTEVSYTEIYTKINKNTEHDGEFYQDNGDRAYYVNGAWRSSNSNRGNTYNGDVYKKVSTSETLASGTTFYILQSSGWFSYSMTLKSVANGKKLVYSGGKWTEKSAGGASDQLALREDVYFEKVVKKSNLEDLLGQSIPETITIDGITYIRTTQAIYNDDQCTSEFTGESDENKMPSAAMQFFVCYTPDYETVTLNLTAPNGASAGTTVTWKSGTAVKFDELRAKTSPDNDHALMVPGGFSLDGYISDNSGEYRACFTPQCEGYEFLGWATSKDSATADFYASMPVTGALQLYPVWSKIEGFHKDQNRIVRVYHVKAGTNETILSTDLAERVEGQPVNGNGQLLPYQQFELKCGETHVLKSVDSDVYFPISSIRQEFVPYYESGEMQDEKNIIEVTFEYKKVEPWVYTVEYKVHYRSYENEQGLMNGASATYTAGAKTWEETSSYSFEDLPTLATTTGYAYSQYQSVVYETPDGFGSYNLKEIVYEKLDQNGSTVGDPVRTTDNTYVVIDKGEDDKIKVKVTFVLEPDPSAVALTDDSKIYDGAGAKIVDSSAGAVFAAPAGYTVKVSKVYAYVSNNGSTAIPAEKVIDSGCYRMNGCVVLDVKDDKGVSSRYLLASADALCYRVQPRPVTLKSDSGSKAYDGTPLTAENVTASCAYGTPFVGTDGMEYYFSADAFRLNPGTTDNAFTYSFKSGTKPENYFITVEYGTLEVK